MTAPAIEPTGDVLPAVVLDIEISDPLPTVAAVGADGRRVRQAWMLVRLFTEPIGTVLVDVPEHGLRPADLAARDRGRAGRPRSRPGWPSWR